MTPFLPEVSIFLWEAGIPERVPVTPGTASPNLPALVRKGNPGIGMWWVGPECLVTGLAHLPNHTCAVASCLPKGHPAGSWPEQRLEAQ